MCWKQCSSTLGGIASSTATPDAHMSGGFPIVSSTESSETLWSSWGASTGVEIHVGGKAAGNGQFADAVGRRSSPPRIGKTLIASKLIEQQIARTRA